MFDFREIELADRDWICERLAVSDFRGCEYSFANNTAWRRLNDTLITRYKDFYICCSFYDGKPVIIFPTGVKCDDSGKEKYISLFCELKKYVNDQGYPFSVCSITDRDLGWIKEYYGDSIISVTSDRGVCDYIYSARSLIELSGKKYHGKRNHIKHFKESDWSFEPLTQENFGECIAFAAQSYNDANGYDDHSAVVEQFAINTFFNNFDYMRLKGGILRSDGRLVGFTIGEKLNSDTFVVHIEKADQTVQGAYPTLCNEFAKACADDCRYINREEDLGIEGLRKSKLSYHPEFLLEKYTVSFK